MILKIALVSLAIAAALPAQAGDGCKSEKPAYCEIGEDSSSWQIVKVVGSPAGGNCYNPDAIAALESQVADFLRTTIQKETPGLQCEVRREDSAIGCSSGYFPSTRVVGRCRKPVDDAKLVEALCHDLTICLIKTVAKGDIPARDWVKEQAKAVGCGL